MIFPQLILGRYLFCVPTATYQSMTRRWAWRWAAVERAGRKQAIQYVGRSAETIDIKGMLFPHLHGGWTQLAQMKKQADRFEPLVLVTALGEVLGDFVITDLEESGSRHVWGPLAGKIDFNMKLVEYSPDQPVPSGPGRASVTPASDAP